MTKVTYISEYQQFMNDTAIKLSEISDNEIQLASTNILNGSKRRFQTCFRQKHISCNHISSNNTETRR